MAERSVEARLAVVDAALSGYGIIEATAISRMTERHHFELPSVHFRHAPLESLPYGELRGVILRLEQGLPGRRHLRFMAQMQARGLATYVAWPHEQAIEVIDRERLSSLRRHWLAALIGNRLRAAGAARRTIRRASDARSEPADADLAALRAQAALLRGEVESLRGHISGGVAALRAMLAPEAAALAEHFEGSLLALERMRTQTETLETQIARVTRARTSLADAPSGDGPGPYAEADLPAVMDFLRMVREDPSPVAFSLHDVPEPQRVFAGTGVYLRLDFWAPLTSGGSYGHTCYQARALASTCRDFVCVMANRFPLLDELGVRQAVLAARDATQTEANLLGMNLHYAERLMPLFEALRPAFIFERAVLGNAVGAWLSRRLGIPYVVEYNGSEISMKKSFAQQGYAHEDLLLAAEDAVFRQATLVSVVSDHVAADLMRRGVPRERILVNPNAVDLQAYSPAAPDEARRLRAQLGFLPQHRVVGFIGTFGGWHGIEVLAAALPRIVAGDERVRVLLIGDGHLKSLVRDAVAAAGIGDRVVDVGRVPQEKGAQLLKACDILVSPHSRNMVDSPFFGSPTKLFEYMAIGAGIVASDLEQIGLVLAPALRNADFAAAKAAGRPVEVDGRRAVLCRPGDVDDFVEAVLHLARDEATCAALGRNARAAAARFYTWEQHVRNLWLRLAGRPLEGYAADWRDKGVRP